MSVRRSMLASLPPPPLPRSLMRARCRPEARLSDNTLPTEFAELCGFYGLENEFMAMKRMIAASGAKPLRGAAQEGAAAEMRSSKILALEHALANDLSIASPGPSSDAAQDAEGQSSWVEGNGRAASSSSGWDTLAKASVLDSVEESRATRGNLTEEISGYARQDEGDASARVRDDTDLPWQISLSDSCSQASGDDLTDEEDVEEDVAESRPGHGKAATAATAPPTSSTAAATFAAERAAAASDATKQKKAKKPSLRLGGTMGGGVRASLTADPSFQMSELEWQAKADPAAESRRVKWAHYGLERDAALLFAALREKWGSVSAGFNSMVQLKDRRDFDYTRAEYGSFTEKELTAHIMKTRIGRQDWLAGVRAICVEANISQKTAGEIFDVLDSKKQQQISHAQLYAGYKGAGMLSCGGGGIPLSLKLKGLNKKKASKLTRFHHLPTDAVKVPEHRMRKVRSLGETLDWHDRVQPCGAASYQSIGLHNGRGWEISNTEMATRTSESATPTVTPRTMSTPRSSRPSVSNTPRSAATPRGQGEDKSKRSSLLPGHGTRFSSASFLPEYSAAYGKEIGAPGAAAPKIGEEWGAGAEQAAHPPEEAPGMAAGAGGEQQAAESEVASEDDYQETGASLQEAEGAATAGVLLIALTALRLKEGAPGVAESAAAASAYGDNLIMSAALTSACRHIERAHGPIPAWFERAVSDSAGGAAQVALTRESFSAQLSLLGVGHMISLSEAEYAFLAADLHSKGHIQGAALEVSLRSHAVEHTALIVRGRYLPVCFPPGRVRVWSEKHTHTHNTNAHCEEPR